MIVSVVLSWKTVRLVFLFDLFRDEAKKKKRQTFVFSATLTTIHSGPNRLLPKKVKLTETHKLGKSCCNTSTVM